MEIQHYIRSDSIPWISLRDKLINFSVFLCISLCQYIHFARRIIFVEFKNFTILSALYQGPKNA